MFVIIFFLYTFETFVKNWPEEIQLLIYFEDKPTDVDYGTRVKWINFHDVSPDLVNFKQKYKTSDTANGIGMNPKTGKYSYLWDAVKFSHKSFSHKSSIPFLQLSDLATILAIVVFPTPRIPVKR